jgi:cerevisin
VGISGDTSDFSNTGECVDVYAPGEDIVSAWIGAPDVVNVLSGTSMATPHVTGIVAYAMANATLAGSPGLMKEWIRMQGLPRGDGTVLANNGVWSSGGSGEQAMVSPNGIAARSSGAAYKRSLNEPVPVVMTMPYKPTDADTSDPASFPKYLPGLIIS